MAPSRVTMDAREVANLLGLPLATVYSLVRNKKLAHIRVGNRVLFLKEMVDGLLAEGRRKPERVLDNADVAGPETW